MSIDLKKDILSLTQPATKYCIGTFIQLISNEAVFLFFSASQICCSIFPYSYFISDQALLEQLKLLFPRKFVGCLLPFYILHTYYWHTNVLHFTRAVSCHFQGDKPLYAYTNMGQFFLQIYSENIICLLIRPKCPHYSSDAKIRENLEKA